MAAERLNQQKRKRIRIAVLEHRFGEREARLAQEENDAAYQVWYRAIGGDKGLRCVRTIPSGWLRSINHIGACVQDDNGREVVYRRLEHASKVPTPDNLIGGAEIILASEDLGKRIIALDQEHDTIRGEKRRLRQEVDAVLESFRSIKQLREHWPEIAPFLSGAEERSAGELSVPLTRLNHDLGLSSKGDE